MNTLYRVAIFNFFRRHEYRYCIFFSPPPEYDIIFNSGPPYEYVNMYSTRRVVSLAVVHRECSREKVSNGL